MKKAITLLIMAAMVLSLGACAGKSQKRTLIKCPSCGYEGLDYIYQP